MIFLVNFETSFTLESIDKNRRDILIMQEKSKEISLIKRNILIYAETKGITKYEIYQKTGISRSVLSQNNGMTEDNILRFLAHYSEVSPEWLLTGKGSMIKNTGDFEVKKIPGEDINQPTEKKTHSELDKYAIDSMIKRIEALAIENAVLKDKVVVLQKKKGYDENDKLSIASES